jgi:hypothetical protein
VVGSVLVWVAGAWALAGPGLVVGLLRAGGTVSEMGVERVGAVVDSRGPAVEVDTDLGAGSAWTIASATAGTRQGEDSRSGRVAQATRTAKTAVITPEGGQP